jgi:hypothetical protein
MLQRSLWHGTSASAPSAHDVTITSSQVPAVPWPALPAIQDRHRGSDDYSCSSRRIGLSLIWPRRTPWLRTLLSGVINLALRPPDAVQTAAFWSRNGTGTCYGLVADSFIGYSQHLEGSLMKRQIFAAVAALSTALTLTVAGVAAVAPGTYKGSLHQASGAKIVNAPATISVVGTKVTIDAPRLPVKCLSASGTYTMPSAPIRYVFKGPLKGNQVSGNYISPLGGTGEYFVAKGSFFPATNTFVGKLSFVGKCKGTSTLRAKKA